MEPSSFLKRTEMEVIELLHMGANESRETLQGGVRSRMYVRRCGGCFLKCPYLLTDLPFKKSHI